MIIAVFFFMTSLLSVTCSHVCFCIKRSNAHWQRKRSASQPALALHFNSSIVAHLQSKVTFPNPSFAMNLSKGLTAFLVFIVSNFSRPLYFNCCGCHPVSHLGWENLIKSKPLTMGMTNVFWELFLVTLLLNASDTTMHPTNHHSKEHSSKNKTFSFLMNFQLSAANQIFFSSFAVSSQHGGQVLTLEWEKMLLSKHWNLFLRRHCKIGLTAGQQKEALWSVKKKWCVRPLEHSGHGWTPWRKNFGCTAHVDHLVCLCQGCSACWRAEMLTQFGSCKIGLTPGHQKETLWIVKKKWCMELLMFSNCRWNPQRENV